MASIDVVRSRLGNFLFYNVEAAVERNCPNNRLDVLLVQYLLKESNKLPSFAKVQTDAGFTQSAVEITGVWDQIWDAYLNTFEKISKGLGKPVLMDHRVDPVVGGQQFGSISHLPYVILWLNRGYLQQRPFDYKHMADVADCPADLRPALKVQFMPSL